jgi:hypothetical protein
MMMSFKLGYNLKLWSEAGVKAPVISSMGHIIVVGGSGSGKSTALLYWLVKMNKLKVKLYICDFKASKEFEGITDNFAEFEACYELIKSYYEEFLATPEGNNDIKLLIIDEIAGLLTHFEMLKETKSKADEIRRIMSSILMLGRSRNCFLILSMQRYSASIFPSSSGAGDNFHICVGLGRLTVDGRKGLFAGEHLENEEKYTFGTGKGIALIDGRKLEALIIPNVNKKRLLKKLQGAKG